MLSPDRIAAIKMWREVIWVWILGGRFFKFRAANSTSCTESAQLPVLQRAVEADICMQLPQDSFDSGSTQRSGAVMRIIGTRILQAAVCGLPPLALAVRVSLLDAFGEDCTAAQRCAACGSRMFEVSAVDRWPTVATCAPGECVGTHVAHVVRDGKPSQA